MTEELSSMWKRQNLPEDGLMTLSGEIVWVFVLNENKNLIHSARLPSKPYVISCLS